MQARSPYFPATALDSRIDFQPKMEECLEAHNGYRSLHGVGPLSVDERLNELAQDRANSLAENSSTSQESSGENVYGVVVGPGSTISVQDVVDIWYREGKYYNYDLGEPRSPKDVRHFTQVIWKGTKTLGVGLASSDGGKVYVVCIYEPPGNATGSYAQNVLEPRETPVDNLPPLEQTQIAYDELPNLDCVKSMEKLHAVPSEKLRVWAAWMTKVGEVAVEWQRWLQDNIEIVLVLNKRLRRAQNKGKRDQEVAVSVGSVDSYMTAEDQAEMPAAIEEKSRERSVKASKSALGMSKSKDRMSKTKSIVTANGIGNLPSWMNIETLNVWPLGSPWTPTGEVLESEDEEEREVPQAPRTEAEMEEYMKEFNHQATVYRSYYKHWRETAEQATNEIACRPVMPTWILQGVDVDESREPSSSKSRSVTLKQGNENGETEDGEVFRDAVENPDELEKSNSPPDTVKSASSIVSPKSKSTVSVGGTKSLGSMGTTQSTTLRSRGSSAQARKDEARGNEDIPYFFYVRAEPDIEIAIEHDDEKVIEADPERERIIANYRRHHFNLQEKPGKDGKPWI